MIALGVVLGAAVAFWLGMYYEHRCWHDPNLRPDPGSTCIDCRIDGGRP